MKVKATIFGLKLEESLEGIAKILDSVDKNLIDGGVELEVVIYAEPIKLVHDEGDE